jgi:hypothetical protein
MSEAPTIRDKKFSHFYRPELDALRFFAFLGCSLSTLIMYSAFGDRYVEQARNFLGSFQNPNW